MPKFRNDKGQGSFYYSKTRKRWISDIPTSKKNSRGNRIYVFKSFKDKQEGLRHHRATLKMKDDGLLTGGPRMTVRQFTMRFLEFDAPTTCRPTTINQYRPKIENHILPHIGNMPITDVTSSILQELITKMGEEYAHKSVESIKGIMSSIFSAAVRHEIIMTNPVSRVKLPKAKYSEVSKKQPAWTLAEAQRVIATEWGSEMNSFICLALCTGMRKGEMLGLQWGDIDLDAGTIYIQRTLCNTTNISTDGSRRKSELVFNEPKTVDSKRFLQVQTDALVGLRIIKENQEFIKREKGSLWNPLGLVFCEPSGRPINPSTQLSRYKRFLKKHAIRYITIHDNRHTFAELLVGDEAQLQQVQQALGHHDIQVTKNVYARDIPVLGQQATAHIARLLFPQSDVAPMAKLPKVIKTSSGRKNPGGRSRAS